MISHFFWLPSTDAIDQASEDLTLQRNTNKQGAGYTGLTRPGYPALGHDMHFSGYLYCDEDLRFTREAWMGQIRASRGASATLSPDQVAAFDAEHDALLKKLAPSEFTITHRIDAHILRLGRAETD